VTPTDAIRDARREVRFEQVRLLRAIDVFRPRSSQSRGGSDEEVKAATERFLAACRTLDRCLAAAEETADAARVE